VSTASRIDPSSTCCTLAASRAALDTVSEGGNGMRLVTLVQTCAIVVVVMLHSATMTAMQEAKDGEIQFIGSYSQLRETPEHVYGYQLELWRDGRSLVGLWTHADGEPGDFPIVLVSDLKWNEATGSFRFNARWCDEVETFDGNLTPMGVVGTVTNGARGGGTGTKVSLRKSGPEWPITSRTDWASMIETMIKRRGPKC